MTDSTTLASTSRSTLLYRLLLAVQTLGAIVLCWQGLPIYRSLYANIASYDPNFGTAVWVMLASALIQAAYWTGYFIAPAPPRVQNAVVGHIVLFVSRVLFILASAIFSFLFISKSLEDRMSILRYAGILFALFSLFCYTRELNRFGTRLVGHRG